jgi:pimeloyl-ACP methyl ester carboxylesterase
MWSTTELAIGEARFKVRILIEGEGSPLLYLHGFDGHPGEAPFLQRLASATGRRVYAPETPGCGESTGIEQIDDIVDMTLFHRQLVETLGLGASGVDVVGHSLGGMFAAEFAALCPQLTRRLVLVSPFGLWLDEAQVPDLFAMSPGQLQRSTWHDPESPVAQQTLTAMANGAGGGVAAAVMRAGNLSTAGKFLWPIPDRGLLKRLPFVKAPTLVVVGASDKLVGPTYGEAFASGIAGARLATIANAGHSPMIEQPEEFERVVTEFLGAGGA